MESNKNKAILNSITSVMAQIVAIFFSFFIRRYLVRLCNMEIMGMHGVLNELVSFLSLFELGISASIVYRLLAPILCNDKDKILKLITIIKKSYRFIGYIMIFTCVICTLLLDVIISVETVSREYVYFSFFLLAAGTVSSFIISYYRTVFVAYQRQYFCNITDLVVYCVFNILKLVAVIWVKSFLVYLFFQGLQGLCGNLIIRKFCMEQFPFLKEKSEVTKADQRVVFVDIKNISISRIAGYVYSSTDMSIVSAVCGTITAGYISNYKLIFSPLRNIINIFNTTLVPTMGNYINKCEDRKEVHKIFQIYTFFEYLISVVLIIPVVVMIDYFVILWIGKEYQISKVIMLLMGWDVFINSMQEPNVTIMNAVGYFKENKLVSEVATLVNIVVSIALAYIFGAVGVFIATIFALIIFFLGRSFIIYRKFFQFSIREYTKYLIGQMGYSLLFGLQLAGLQIIVARVSADKSVGEFIGLCFLCEMMLCILNFLGWRKNSKFQYIKNMMLGFVSKKQNKKSC